MYIKLEVQTFILVIMQFCDFIVRFVIRTLTFVELHVSSSVCKFFFRIQVCKENPYNCFVERI